MVEASPQWGSMTKHNKRPYATGSHKTCLQGKIHKYTKKENKQERQIQMPMKKDSFKRIVVLKEYHLIIMSFENA